MGDKRKGRQIPTISVSLPYEATKGNEAVELYNKSEKLCQEWQELLLYDILAVNDEGLWTHTKYGFSVPRRNGKSEILIMRELWGFVNGERILHTAHRTTTSHASWERCVRALTKCGFVEGVDFKTLRQFGLERIEWINGMDGVINFRTRSSKSGLGEGFDTLVIDEAQEYTDDQESALKYVVTDSLNPQTIMCGTPPTTVSAGTVFTKFRDNTIQGKTLNGGWAEWSVEFKSDCNDIDLWYQTNPSLGTVFTERAVADEVGTDDIDFNIQRLGLWLKYNQKSAISKNEWKALEVTNLPNLKGGLFVGIKYAGDSVSMAIAVKCESGIFVEAIDCQSQRNGDDWIVQTLAKMKPSKIVIDGAGRQNILAKELADYGISNVVLPTTKDVVVAYAQFEQAIYSKSLIHMQQESLEQSVSNCEKRAIGTNGGFGYKSIMQGVEISLLESVALAHWMCSETKEKRKQKLSY